MELSKELKDKLITALAIIVGVLLCYFIYVKAYRATLAQVKTSAQANTSSIPSDKNNVSPWKNGSTDYVNTLIPTEKKDAATTP